MTTLEILKAGRALIADEARWTQQAPARDKNGIQLLFGHSEGAVCWCSLGAIDCVSKSWDDEVVAQLGIHMRGGIAFYNDTRHHATVLAAWDAAIAELEAE